MILEIEAGMAKITSVTPLAEKIGKKRRPAHSVIFEFQRENTAMSPFHPLLRDSFYMKPERPAEEKRTGQKKLDVSNTADGKSALKFPWWAQWIELPGELTGYEVRLHTGNTPKSHIVLDDAKIGGFLMLPKPDGIVLLRLKAIVHPGASEKGRIDELLQSELPVSITPPSDGQGELIGGGGGDGDE